MTTPIPRNLEVPALLTSAAAMANPAQGNAEPITLSEYRRLMHAGQKGVHERRAHRKAERQRRRQGRRQRP